MADSIVVNVEQNNYRNVILRCTLVSDGSGVAAQKIYDATSGGVYGVTQGGQPSTPASTPPSWAWTSTSTACASS
jgi:hypothetical protein